MRDVLPSLVAIAIETSVYWTLMVLVGMVLVLIDDGQHQFASRWAGTCTGWTQGLTWFHTAADLATAWGYIAIGLSVARLHPVMRFVRSAPITVGLITTVFFTCAATHAVKAFTNFVPWYLMSGYVSLIGALAAVAGAAFVAHDLSVAGNRMSGDREDLLQMIEDLK